MKWRDWCYQVLYQDPVMAGLLDREFIYGAGGIDVNPEKKPFVVLRFGSIIPTLKRAASFSTVAVWAHDEPGDYARIDAILERVRAVYADNRPGTGGPITIEWSGDSTDLADDGYGTITRNSTYRLVTVEANP